MFYEDEILWAEFEPAEVPWVKLFLKREWREISECDAAARAWLFGAGVAVERALLAFYAPAKVNWASFANYVPRVHLHVMARFCDDSFFPESMWGKRQRDGAARDLRLGEFAEILRAKLAAEFSSFRRDFGLV